MRDIFFEYPLPGRDSGGEFVNGEYWRGGAAKEVYPGGSGSLFTYTPYTYRGYEREYYHRYSGSYYYTYYHTSGTGALSWQNASPSSSSPANSSYVNQCITFNINVADFLAQSGSITVRFGYSGTASHKRASRSTTWSYFTYYGGEAHVRAVISPTFLQRFSDKTTVNLAFTFGNTTLMRVFVDGVLQSNTTGITFYEQDNCSMYIYIPANVRIASLCTAFNQNTSYTNSSYWWLRTAGFKVQYLPEDANVTYVTGTSRDINGKLLNPRSLLEGFAVDERKDFRISLGNLGNRNLVGVQTYARANFRRRSEQFSSVSISPSLLKDGAIIAPLSANAGNANHDRKLTLLNMGDSSSSIHSVLRYCGSSKRKVSADIEEVRLSLPMVHY